MSNLRMDCWETRDELRMSSSGSNFSGSNLHLFHLSFCLFNCINFLYQLFVSIICINSGNRHLDNLLLRGNLDASRTSTSRSSLCWTTSLLLPGSLSHSLPLFPLFSFRSLSFSPSLTSLFLNSRRFFLLLRQGHNLNTTIDTIDTMGRKTTR